MIVVPILSLDLNSLRKDGSEALIFYITMPRFVELLLISAKLLCYYTVSLLPCGVHCLHRALSV